MKRARDREEIVNDLIDLWHATPTFVPLHTFLGWSWEEYKTFVETGRLPPKDPHA